MNAQNFSAYNLGRNHHLLYCVIHLTGTCIQKTLSVSSHCRVWGGEIFKLWDHWQFGGLFFWMYHAKWRRWNLGFTLATAENHVPLSTWPTWETEVGGGCSLKKIWGKGFSCLHVGTAVARERSLQPEAHCGVRCITNIVNNPLFITHPTAFELNPLLYQMRSALEREETLGHTHGLHLALQKPLEFSLFFSETGLRAALENGSG